MTRIPTECRAAVPMVSQADLDDCEALIDVRELDEWRRGRAPLARHIPLGELESRLAEIPRDDRLVVTCRGGGRASRAVAFLRAEGFDALVLEGGMLEWTRRARPLRHDGSGTPTVE